MEEEVGKIWHKFITKTANKKYQEQSVTLFDITKVVGVMFRAFGGDGGLRIEAATATNYQTRRSFLQRIAGSNTQVELCWRNDEILYLPKTIDVFPSKELNRELYLWLAVLAAENKYIDLPWFIRNQLLTKNILAKFPGLTSRYKKLLNAQLNLRPKIESLSKNEAAQELAIQQALKFPTTVKILPIADNLPQAVYLWLHPAPPIKGFTDKKPNNGDNPSKNPNKKKQEEQQRRYSGKQTESPEENKGLLAIRMESNWFSWAEHAKVDRCTDDEDDDDAAQKALEDLDEISVVQDNKKTKGSILRFDLDLPSSEFDDTTIANGILLPEWDYKRQIMHQDYCRLQPMIATDAEAIELPINLRRTAKRLRGQLEALMPTRIWHKGEQDGNEIDLDAYLLYAVDKYLGQADSGQGLYRDFRGGVRDLSCLLLADLSLSTDTWVNNECRVIDVVRDTLFLFSEALTATGDRFSLYGFSSRSRDPIRWHIIKTFAQAYNAKVRGRIQAIKPGFYTRMGTAIRYATKILNKEKSTQRLLLLLTDGKPNDIDQYEGRYGIEDTRYALHEARKQGLQVFCVTIDEKAADYLPHLFGTNNFVVIKNPSELPKELPLLYAQITNN
jgi:nitric oxide reductase NorD protein